MLTGEYIFYEDGKEIYRSKNIITKFGKRYLTNFIAGNIASAKKDLALGIGSTAATDVDTRLNFEFYRLPVSFGSIDIQTIGLNTTYAVVYKATIPQDVAGIIKEVGLYPSTRSSVNNYDNKFISDFEDNTIWFDSGGFNPPLATSPAARIGAGMMQITTSGASTSKEYFSNIAGMDISGYSVNDSITFAYNKADNNLASLKIRFYSSPSNYYEASVTPTANTGERIQSVNLSSLFASPVGNPDASAITRIGIIATSNSSGASTVYLDGVRINDEDTFDPAFGIISRSVLAAALNKVAGRQVEIEYRLGLSF